MKDLPILVIGNENIAALKKQLQQLIKEHEENMCEFTLYNKTNGECELDLDDLEDININDISIGEALRGMRYHRCLSQRDLAWLTNISQKTISAVENNKKSLTTSQIRRISNLFGVDERIFMD